MNQLTSAETHFRTTDALRGCNLSYATPLPMGGVWKNATEESARRGTLKFLPTEGGSRMQ
jgi:hypothetical protein